jgi:beta-lactamase superfamily II metal-dependent hydrolase
MATRFVGLGVKGEKDSGRYLFEADRKTRVRQVLWGDFLNVESEEADGWLKVVWAPRDPARRRELFIPKAHTVEKRPLEIVFVDVGQGDGSVLITPEVGSSEKIIVIDAGEGDNMERFLNGRFKAYRGFGFDAAVITHPDKDHYLGFKAIFANPKIGFRTVYHSGLMERPVGGTFQKLGGLKAEPGSGTSYLTDLPEDKAAVEAIFGDPAQIGGFEFPGVIHAAVTNPKVKDYRILSTEHGTREDGKTYMPGFAPSDSRGYCIEVLGPVMERDAAGKPRLRRIKSYGETKNGHSILLRLTFGQFSIFFGGDLNEPAERFILQHYAGLDEFPFAGTAEYRQMVAAAGQRFRSDVMKVCHHGSEKVTDAFLEAVNPACFIISSGDEEGHVHPRPDLLGRLGRFGRGSSPVLLSTELQRSTREREQQDRLDTLLADIDRLATTPTPALKADIRSQVTRLARTNVEVYGAIYVKTDGERLITAFRIEEGSDTDKWFYFEYVFTASGELVLA